MKFTVLTLFPDIVKAFFENSIMAKAVQKEIIAYDLVNIRDFANDKHHSFLYIPVRLYCRAYHIPA